MLRSNDFRTKKTFSTKIETEYAVEALTASIDVVPSVAGGGAFVGAFSIPGKDRQFAKNDDGSIASFHTEDEAIAAAGEDLCEAMNARTRAHFHSYGYRVMGGAELAVRLKEVAVSPASFAMYCGTTLDRVMEWIDGKTPIPRTVNLIAELMTLPGAVDAAQALTDRITFKKHNARAAR